MPGYERAELTAELKVNPSPKAERPPGEQIEAARRSAGETGLAHEAGPETLMLAGGRKEALEAITQVVEAALDAGALGVDVKVEIQADAPRFDRG